MTKTTIIGAGSAAFAQRMIADVLATEGLEAGEFALNAGLARHRLRRQHHRGLGAAQRAARPRHLAALRGRPVWLAILHDTGLHNTGRPAPGAVVMNHTNPMGALTLLSACGLGLRAAAERPESYEQDIVRFEMPKRFGAIFTESSGHFGEHVPSFRKRSGPVAKDTRTADEGESSSCARDWPRWRDGHQAQVEWLIAQRITCNLPDTGLTDNLPPDGVVEVSCLIDGQGVHPQPFGRLPGVLAALDRPHMAIHRLLADLVLTPDWERAVQARPLDLLPAAGCSPAGLRAMFRELVETEAHDLPAHLPADRNGAVTA